MTQDNTTPREIIKALLSGDMPERVGLNEHFWPFIVANGWDEQGISDDTDFVERFNLDIRKVCFFSCPGPRPDLISVLEETDEWVVRRDAWGAAHKSWKHKAGTPEHVSFAMNSPEVWKRDFRDQVAAIDLRASVDLDTLRERYSKAMAEDRFVTIGGLFVFEDLRRILGDVIMLESLLLEPEWIHDVCSLLTDKYMEFYELYFSEIGMPDGMHIYEDLGYTAAPFCSPACHRELVLPYHNRLFGMFKDHGLPIIMHTCGDFRPHIDAIIESGVDCIQAMEAKTGMNVVELAEQYRDRLCFMGNIDVRALESGDQDRIREECLGKLNGMKALRAPYVYMSDHSIPQSVTVKDYEFMLDIFWENCRY